MKTAFITAAEAAALLGINRSTLYAYVSRGYVRSEPVPGKPRERRYSSEDVERLRRSTDERRDPGKAAQHVLRWGLPILESEITLIAGGKLYYRGRDACELARTSSIEDVVSLIWTGETGADMFGGPLHVVAGGRASEEMPFINRAQSMLPLVAARDPLAYDLRPKAVAQTGWGILNLLTSVAVESSELEATIEETLQLHWAPTSEAAADLIRAALIACADHELNVSSFTARCVASAGSNPYAVVLAGLAAIEGIKHGGATERVSALFDSARKPGSPRKAFTDRMRRGETVEGFGHALYPDGDPRATLLLDLLHERVPKSKELKFARDLATAAEEVLGEKPTVDFALVAMELVLALPRASALTLFALGRTIGLIGHAIEQYEEGTVIRPRARYVGTAPAE